MYSYILNILVDIFEILLFATMSYYLGTAFFSLFGGSKNSKHKHDFKYIAVIPAKNEEACITTLIESIRSSNYPQDKISILVIADDCSDNTEGVSKTLGADVYVRQKSTTKGDALSEAFEYIKSTGKDYDCIAVFDADNIVDREFFTEMSEQLSQGHSAIQGYIDSKNPNSSWVSYAYSLWYWISNRVVQSGRGKLNLGCRLGGTGFVLTRDLLDKVKWSVSTVAEDLEYTYKLAENNIRVSFCERAVVYDEKPKGFYNSVGQRVRWAKGICDVQGEYTPKLLKRGDVNGLLGLWADVLIPLNFTLLASSFFLKIGGIWQTTVGAVVLWICLSAYLLCVLLALLKDKKLSFKTVFNIFGFAIYLISWIPIGIFGIFGKRSVWYQTKHDSKI